MEIVFLYILCLSSASAFLELQNNEKPKTLTNCVVKFVEEWKTNNDHNSHLHLTLININNCLKLDELHKLKGLRFISRTSLQEIYTPTIPSVAYVIVSENYVELTVTLTQLSEDLYWNPTARFIIVIQDARRDINKTSKLLQKHNIFNVTLVTYLNNDYALYEYNVTSDVSSIESEELVFVSWCSQFGYRSSLPALVKRTGIIHGYRFKFIASDLWPFTNLNDPSTEGTEEHLLNLFKNNSGVQIDLIFQPEYDAFGNFIPDYIYEMLHKVHTGEFEGTLGGYSLRSAYQFYNYSGNLSYTYPLAVDHLVYILPRANALTPWQALLRRCFYSCLVSGLLFIVFCIATILLAIFPLRQKQAARNVFIVLGYILNKTSVRIISSRFPHRLIVTNILFFAFIMPYALQAYLYSVITSPVPGYEPTNVDELSDKKLILYTEFKQTKGILQFERDCGSRLNCLFDVKNKADKSFYTLMADSLYRFHIPELIDGDCDVGVYRLKDPYIMLLRVVFLRRGSILLKPLTKFLFNAMSAGLLNKYAGDLYYKNGIKCKSLHQIKKKALKLHDLSGAFIILLVGNCLSMVVFTCEIFISKKLMKV